MPRQLLEGPIEKETADAVIALVEFWSDKDPSLREATVYWWKLRLEGNKNFQRVRRLSITLKFPNEPLSVCEIAPKRTENGEITLTLSAAGWLGLSVPVRKKDIIGRLNSQREVEWTFKNIKLDKKFKQIVEWAITVVFDEGTEYKPIPISMRIESDFCNRWGKSPPTQPILSEELMEQKLPKILPYVREQGRPSQQDPDERILEDYTWRRVEGKLFKGKFRNVSLRTEALSMLLKEFREKLTPEGLKDVRRTIGRKFVERIEDDTNNKLNPDSWSDYDSTAGMGCIGVFDDKGMRIHVIEDKVIIKSVEVMYSFEAYDQYPEDNPICYFFTGYIEGVLSKMSGKTIYVEEQSCIAQGKDKCTFLVKV
jgi:predicted hydrocarbon binding protein